MKKFLFITSCIVLFSSCGKQDIVINKENLNGYWTIEKVVLTNGNEKKFQMSTTVDFIEVNGNAGVRKKMQPRLDGTFITNNDAETFQLKVEDDSLRMYYKTPYDSWKETVLKAKDSSLVVLNSDGKTYFYKKFEKFDFN